MPAPAALRRASPAWRAAVVVGLSALAVLIGCTPRVLVVYGLVQPSPAYVAARPGFAWDTVATRAVDLAVERAALPPADTLAQAVERALGVVLDSLGVETYPHRVHAFAVASPERMQALLGHRVTGRAFYGTQVFAFVPGGRAGEATLRHELAHLVAGRLWGRYAAEWVSEGVATYVGTPWAGDNLHAVARRTLVAPGVALPLPELASGFRRHPDGVTYLQAASVVQFVRERYGAAGLRQLWTGGLDALPALSGMSVEAVEAAWRQTVQQAE